MPMHTRNTKSGLSFLLYAHIGLLFFVLWGCAGVEYREYDVAMIPSATQAEIYFREGDYENALPMYEKALQVYRQEKNDTGALYCLEKMGWILREIGRYGDALRMFQQAYPLGVKLNGDAAEIAADMGDVYLFSGDPEKSRGYYEKCLRILRDFVFKTKYTRPPGRDEITTMVRKTKAIIHARVSLAAQYYFSEEYEKALEHLKAADDLLNKVLMVANDAFYNLFIKLPADVYEGIGFCQTLLAATYGELGRYEAAWEYFDKGREAFETADRQFGLVVNRALRFKIEFQSTGLKIDEAKFAAYDELLDQADRIGAVEVTWRMGYIMGHELAKVKRYRQAEKYLALAVNALELTRSRLREDTIKKMFASSVQDVYSEMIRLLFTMKRFEDGFDYLERAKARAFLDLLAGRSVKEKKAVDARLIKKEKEIQHLIDVHARKLKTVRGGQKKAVYQAYKKLLRERANVLEAIKGQSLEFAATTTVATVPVRRIAQRLPADTALISYFLGKDKSIIWVVVRGNVHAVSIKIGQRMLAGLVSDYREAISSMQDMLFKDLGRRLSRLLIEPVRSRLNGVSRLLIVPSGSLHYLPFSSLPLGNNRYLVQDYTITILPNASSLFFLDKAVTRNTDSLLALGNPDRGKEVPPLAFAEKEVQSISGEFAAAEVFTGPEAKESILKDKHLIGTGVIHIAAHGRYDIRNPLKSALLLAKDGKNDGNLETFEIFSLSMNPGLVVLSACESGVGKVEGGDEVQSLNRAFLYAGAGGVMASLWSVSDQSTFRLMTTFYDQLKKSPPAEALRKAQIRLMATDPSPFYWAPFYLTGGFVR